MQWAGGFMSTCISSHGEFGSHTLDPLHYCSLCGVLDEDTLRADLRSAKVEASNYAYQRDEARRERDKLNTELAEEKRRTKAQLAERQKDYSKTLKESAAEVERLTSDLGVFTDANEGLGKALVEARAELTEGEADRLNLEWRLGEAQAALTEATQRAERADEDARAMAAILRQVNPVMEAATAWGVAWDDHMNHTYKPACMALLAALKAYGMEVGAKPADPLVCGRCGTRSVPEHAVDHFLICPKPDVEMAVIERRVAADKRVLDAAEAWRKQWGPDAKSLSEVYHEPATRELFAAAVARALGFAPSTEEWGARAEAALVIGGVVEALVSDCPRCGGLDGTHTVRNCAVDALVEVEDTHQHQDQDQLHRYLSTACYHGLHDKCRLMCKYCGVGCSCEHHKEPCEGCGGDNAATRWCPCGRGYCGHCECDCADWHLVVHEDHDGSYSNCQQAACVDLKTRPDEDDDPEDEPEEKAALSAVDRDGEVEREEPTFLECVHRCTDQMAAANCPTHGVLAFLRTQKEADHG